MQPCIASQLCKYAIREFNREKFPGGPEKGSDETDRERNDPKEVVELGHLLDDISPDLVGNLLKDGATLTVSNNVKSQRYYSLHCIAHILN